MHGWTWLSWAAEQNKGVVIIWTEKGLEEISEDLSPPCWLQLRKKSSPACNRSEVDSGGSGHHQMHWQLRSDGKQGSLEHAVSRKNKMDDDGKRVHLHQEVSELQISPKVWGFSWSPAGGNPERTSWDAHFYRAKSIFDPNKKLLGRFDNALHCDFSRTSSNPSVLATAGSHGNQMLFLSFGCQLLLEEQNRKVIVPNAPSRTQEMEFCHSSQLTKRKCDEWGHFNWY